MTTFLGMPHRPPAAFGVDSALRGDQPFPKAAAKELDDDQLRKNLDFVTHRIREKRADVVSEMSDWQALRESGSAIKRQVLANLGQLLEEFEAKATEAGAVVHWARDGEEANEIVYRLTRERGQKEVLKIKSMATQEIGLNEFLEVRGIRALETDLAELIVQLGNDKPSHILVPAIHRNRKEIREIFLAQMPGIDPDIDDDPAHLAEAARKYLREKFLDVQVAVSGANFAIAETGTVAIFESEGNGRMTLTLPKTLITVMGIEKLLPKFEDLGVFTQLLPRSSTGERMNPYTSLWTGVTPGDGPEEFHIILLDNGRTRALADEIGREALKCIRCSACLNICPVYEQVGGHAYGSIYPGPIGAILSPLLTGIESKHDPNAYLPFASSLCGACYEVCPVMIDIPSILVELRHQKVEEVGITAEKALMAAASKTMGDSRLWHGAQTAANIGLRTLANSNGEITRLPPPADGWTATRNIPAPPAYSGRLWFKSTSGQAILREEWKRSNKLLNQLADQDAEGKQND